MAFDVEGALKEGYSDSEIADYIASQRKFDLAGARKEGYTDAEIIDHLNKNLASPGFMDNLLKGGGAELETLGDPSNPAAARAVAAAVPALVSGAMSWIPAGLAMAGHEEPEQWLAGDTSVMSQEEKAKGAEIIQNALTIKPKTKEAEQAVRGIAYPLELTDKAGEVGGQYLDEHGHPILAAVSRFAGKAAPFLIPAIPKAVRGLVDTIGKTTWYRDMTIPERGLVVKSLDEMISTGLDEGEILRRWNNPQWRDEALSRRNVGETAPPVEPQAGAPEVSPSGPSPTGTPPPGAPAPLETAPLRKSVVIPPEATPPEAPAATAQQPTPGIPPASPVIPEGPLPVTPGSPVAPVTAPIATPEQSLTGFKTFLETENPDMEPISSMKADILADHPQLADDLIEAIVEHQASKPLVAPKVQTEVPQPGTPSFIQNRIRQLGSIEAVNRVYNTDSEVDQYARDIAPKILEIAPAVPVGETSPEVKGVAANEEVVQPGATPGGKQIISYRGQTGIPFDSNIETTHMGGLVFSAETPEIAGKYAQGQRPSVTELRATPKNMLDLGDKILDGSQDVNIEIRKALNEPDGTGSEIRSLLEKHGYDAVTFKERAGWDATHGRTYAYAPSVLKDYPELSPQETVSQAASAPPASGYYPALKKKVKPQTPEQIAKRKALMSVPANQAVDFIIKNGYLNRDNVKATFGMKAVIQLTRRFFNRAPFGKIGSIVRPDGKLGLDEVATEFPGVFGTDKINPDEHLLDVLLDRSIINKSRADEPALDKQAAQHAQDMQEEAENARQQEIADKIIDLDRYGITEGQIIEVLRSDGFSDEEIVRALEATIKEEIIAETSREEEFAEFTPEEITAELDLMLEQEHLLIAEAQAEGESLVSRFLPAPAAKPTAKDFIGKKETGGISGIPNDFNLVNPETEISRGLKTHEKGQETAGMFEPFPTYTVTESGLTRSTRSGYNKNQGGLFDAVPDTGRDNLPNDAVDVSPGRGVSPVQPRTEYSPAQGTLPSVKSEPIGTWSSSRERITTPEDAAVIARDNLEREAQETYVSIVTGLDGKILAINQHTVGAPNQSQIYPYIIVGQVLNVPSAKKVWTVHNHPSGNAELSKSDLRMDNITADLLRDTGVDSEHIIAVTSKQYHSAESQQNNLDPRAGITDLPKKEPGIHKFNVLGRKYDQIASMEGQSITSRDDLEAFGSRYLPNGGMVLTTTGGNPVAVIEIGDFSKLRSVHADILRQAERRNATSFMVYVPDKALSKGDIDNLTAFNLKAGPSLIFVTYLDKNGDHYQEVKRINDNIGKPGYVHSQETFYSLADKTRETPKGVEMYSVAEREAVRSGASFAEQLDDIEAGKITNRREPVKIGGTPMVLQKLGADPLPLVITHGTIEKATTGKHGISFETLKQLPEQLADPVMVFDSSTEMGSLVVMTELQQDGKTIVAAVSLSSTIHGNQVNDISTVHPRSSEGHFINWIHQGLLRYMNRSKSRAWSLRSGLQLPRGAAAKLGSAKKILFDSDLVKENYSIADLDTTGEPATIATKGEQNGRYAADSESGNRGRDGVLPEVQKEHARQVGNQRQISARNEQAPLDYRKASQDGKGLVHFPEGYSRPEYKELRDIASSFGLEIIPVVETTDTLNAILNDGKIFLNMESGDATEAGKEFLRHVVLHEISHHRGNTETQNKIDLKSLAFQKYRRALSWYYYGSPLRSLPFSHVMREYAADLEAGFDKRYGVRLADGLKKGETVISIQEELASQKEGGKKEARGPPLTGSASSNPSRPPEGGGQQYSVEKILSNKEGYKKTTDKISSMLPDNMFSRIRTKRLWGKSAIQDLKEWYSRPTVFTEVKDIKGKYTGALQIIDHDLAKVAKDINTRIPKDRQEAITRYMQADGDEVLLQERADQSKDYKKLYQDAMTLTESEKRDATTFRKRMDDVWQEANEAGVLDDYVENYVRGEWERPNDAGRKLNSMASAGVFRTNPREALHKVFENYFEGEQAGYKPVNSSIGYQLTVAERSLKNAIEARKAVKALMGSKEVDGRPTISIGGAGSPLSKEKVGEVRLNRFINPDSEAYFIKPNIKGKDTGDYQYLDHPALRKWKWVGKDDSGKPIFLEGNAWVHPRAFGEIDALLGRSRIREYTIPEGVPVIGGTHPGAAALQAGAFVKGTILLGPFHQFHVAEHAVFHKVNPFNLPEIDFDSRPVLKEGVEHGLQLVSHHALQDFGEGLATGGLFHRIPIAGDYLKQYQEWLFQGYIPKLKAAMYEHAVGRAEKYYEKDLTSGKFTRDQLLDNAANQANAAFGEMNYKYMGRSKTLQDAFRIIGLAPDFLEARLRFAGQALRPKGKEQIMALIRGAVIMASLAQIMNLLFGDDHKPHWDRPFSIITGGREYTPRSVVGDMMHLITAPRNFMYQRLNPLWGKPLIEIASGKDSMGRKVDAEDMAKDILKAWVPIPVQGLVKDSHDTFLKSIVNTVLQSVGLSNYEYRSNFDKAVMEKFQEKMIISAPKAERDRLKLVHKYSDELTRKLANKEPATELMEEIRADVQKGNLYREDKQTIRKRAAHTRTESLIKSLSAEDLTAIWDKATPEEQEKYKSIMRTKTRNLRSKHPERYMKLKENMK